MKNEKGIATNDAQNLPIDNGPTMKNCNSTDEKTQPNFDFGKPLKVFPQIICHNCQNERELDGYIFRLVEVCCDCRTASELKHLSNQIARRENG